MTYSRALSFGHLIPGKQYHAPKRLRVTVVGGYGTSDYEVVVAVMDAAAYADKW